MSVTWGEAITAIKARLDGGSYSFPIYYHGDDPPILPDEPSPFAYIVFNNEGSTLAAFGGGRGQNIYRNRARVDSFVFTLAGIGMEATAAAGEQVAGRLRSYRDDVISVFQSDVIDVAPGATLAVPGLSNEVNNYQCAIAETLLFFDQIG
jgi:hypothetical protein